jgi:hypothetical protein
MVQRNRSPYERGTRGVCPHCRLVVSFDVPTVFQSYTSNMKVGSAGDMVYVYSSECPGCRKPIVVAHIQTPTQQQYRLVHPFGVSRTVPAEVPEHVKEDFLEAAAVSPISQKASAALSRRCLQSLLTDMGYKQRDLAKQIDAALKDLPTAIAKNLDAIRNIGNFAAHPMKHKSTGTIVDVEPEEAEWNLDVLEDLFDHYYVQPKKAEAKRIRLDKKLQSLGKPQMKKPL